MYSLVYLFVNVCLPLEGNRDCAILLNKIFTGACITIDAQYTVYLLGNIGEDRKKWMEDRAIEKQRNQFKYLLLRLLLVLRPFKAILVNGAGHAR